AGVADLHTRAVVHGGAEGARVTAGRARVGGDAARSTGRQRRAGRRARQRDELLEAVVEALARAGGRRLTDLAVTFDLRAVARDAVLVGERAHDASGGVHLRGGRLRRGEIADEADADVLRV